MFVFNKIINIKTTKKIKIPYLKNEGKIRFN